MLSSAPAVYQGSTKVFCMSTAGMLASGSPPNAPNQHASSYKTPRPVLRLRVPGGGSAPPRPGRHLVRGRAGQQQLAGADEVALPARQFDRAEFAVGRLRSPGTPRHQHATHRLIAGTPNLVCWFGVAGGDAPLLRQRAESWMDRGVLRGWCVEELAPPGPCAR